MRVFIKATEQHDSDVSDVCCMLAELEDKVGPATATHIVCESALDNEVDRTAGLQKILSRLRYGGKLVITGIDIEEISREFTVRTINEQQAQSLLYGGRRSASTIGLVVQELINNGLTIVNSRLKDFHYYVLAERNVKPKNNM